jgi:hypothetical protein
MSKFERTSRKDSEQAISKHSPHSVEYGIIDVCGSKTTFECEGNKELYKFKTEANCYRKPKDGFRFDLDEESDSKAKRHGEEDVFNDISRAKFWHDSARIKIERN